MAFGRALHHIQAAGRILYPFCAALVFATLTQTASGQNTLDRMPTTPSIRLTRAQLQADFALFQRAYRELHPGLYRYNSRAQMDRNFQALQKRLDRDLTLPETYLAFATFLNKIKCGHSYPNFYNQPAAVVQALFKSRDRVPFHFRWIDQRMIVTRNVSRDVRLVPGVEVRSINGVPVGTILKTLLTVSRADGSNDAKRISDLEIRGTSRYEAFDIYFPLFFPLKEVGFALNVRSPQRGTLTLHVDALDDEQRLAPYKAEIEALRSDQPVWEFRMLNAQSADLRMPTWSVFDSKWDWKRFLDRTFERIDKRIKSEEVPH